MDMPVRWLAGFLTGAVWSAINFLLIINILKVGLLQKDKTRLTAMLLLKFPVLYLLGFLILISRIFPVPSLLLGGFLVLVVMGVIRLCRKPRL